MTQPNADPRPDDNRDLARVTQELAGRLRARGIAVYDADSPTDVVRLLESVEAYERAVEAHGGDLMVDEPPARGEAQPDDPHFLLPKRRANETVKEFLERLAAVTAAVRQHRRHS